MIEPKQGTILIADPFLKDPNFMRTAVFLCSYAYEEAFGFVLNRKISQVVGELLFDLKGCEFPVFYGGPVQLDTIYFLHQNPEIIEGGIEIIDGIYWGGNFEDVFSGIRSNQISAKQIRFYLGYSGWGLGQLDNELKEKTWLTTYGTSDLVFHQDAQMIWPDSLKQIGGEYEQLINYPIDPQLN